MKILLISPPWLRLFGLSDSQFPLNLGYLAAELRKNGHHAIIAHADFDVGGNPQTFVSFEKVMRANYDQYIATLNDLNQPIWQSIKRTIETIAPDVVGITAMTATYGSSINVARCVKKVDKNIHVVLGGMHPTIFPENVVKESAVDFVIVGEGEVALVELLKAIERNNYNRIGFEYKSGKYIIHSDLGMNVENINELEFPARDLLLDKENFHGNVFGSMMGSRGCPFRCVFCSSHKMWRRKVRFRSSENIVDEMLTVRDKFKTRRFYFHDDTFTLNNILVLELCRQIRKKQLNIRWTCPTRVDRVEKKVITEMKKAGCRSLSLGIESGSEDTLRRINKNITLEQVRNSIKVIKDTGMEVMGFFVFGFPWETKRHFSETLDFIEELNLDVIQYNYAVPLPGTELWEMVKNENILPPHNTPLDWARFYQHSPVLPLLKKIGAKDKKLLTNEIVTRLDALNLKSALLREKIEQSSNSGIGRYKHYLRHPRMILNKIAGIVH